MSRACTLQKGELLLLSSSQSHKALRKDGLILPDLSTFQEKVEGLLFYVRSPDVQ